MPIDRQRLLGMLGFARRAGKITIGTELVCRSLAAKEGKRPQLVLYAESASAPTKDKVRRKATYYGIPALELPIDQASLGHLLGKTSAPATVGVYDKGFAEEIVKSLGILPQSLRKGVSAEAETGDIHGTKND